MENEKPRPKTLAEVLQLRHEHNSQRDSLPGPWSSDDMVVELLAEILVQITAMRELAAGHSEVPPAKR